MLREWGYGFGTGPGPPSPVGLSPSFGVENVERLRIKPIQVVRQRDF